MNKDLVWTEMPYSLIFFVLYLSYEFVSICVDVTYMIVEHGQGSNCCICPNAVNDAISEAATP